MGSVSPCPMPGLYARPVRWHRSPRQRVVLRPAPGLTASLVACVAALPGAQRLVQVVTGDEETADLLAVTAVDQAYVLGSGRAAARIAGSVDNGWWRRP